MWTSGASPSINEEDSIADKAPVYLAAFNREISPGCRSIPGYTAAATCLPCSTFTLLHIALTRKSQYWRRMMFQISRADGNSQNHRVADGVVITTAAEAKSIISPTAAAVSSIAGEGASVQTIRALERPEHLAMNA